MLETLERTDSAEIAAAEREFVMGTYARQPVVFVRGQGARLWDSEGKEYLDFLAGISVCSVGHCHPRVARAIAEQAQTLIHVSNLYHNPLQAKLAERLCGLSGMEKAFFCNSGAEANECAIKIARKWGKQQRGPERHEIVCFTGSFHGRTLTTVTATANAKYQEPFTPLPAGFRHIAPGDVKTLDEAITEKTCAVMIEPIQGEAGIQVIPSDFLKAARVLCDEAGILLILDEIQCGMGRTGSFLASQHVGIKGDIVTLAKAVASGVPMGVCLASGEAANTLAPGDHGSTFGGQPLACAAALATLDVLEEEGLMENATRVGNHFLSGLRALRSDRINEVRGVGLMVGVELANPDAKTIQKALLEQGIVINAVGDTILRFLPPLVVTESDCDRVVDSLADLLA